MGGGQATDLAWAAGVLDVSGTCVGHGKTFRWQLRKRDRELLERLQGVLGGRIYGPYEYAAGGDRRPSWMWASDGVCPHRIAEKLRPYLTRGKRARLAELGV